MNDTNKIGLVAGWGRYPIVVAQTLKQQGLEVHCLGVKNHADKELIGICDSYHEVGLGRLGAAIRFFRRHGVKQATMAGKIHKHLLFRRFMFFKHLPDWRGIRAYYPMFLASTRDRRDNTIIGIIIDTYAEDGIHFAPATDFAPELLVKLGQIGGPSLSKAQQQDVEFGWKMARELGRLDIGQSVVVKGRAVLAVEAIEGTDRCIERAGEVCTGGGFTVVKVAKPGQDMRFDVPTVGVNTVRTIVKAGGRVLAIEADKTIIIDQKEVAALANKHRLAIVALSEPAEERVERAA